MKAIKIGIVGVLGMRGQDFLRLFSQIESEVVVTAVADTNSKVLYERFGNVSTVGIYTNTNDLMRDKNVDTVLIASPDYLHEEHACSAFNFGKNVYLEKPMAITPEGCDRIIDIANKSNRILYVGHNLRHFTVIKKLKELIDIGAVGDVKTVWCRHPVSYGEWAYFKADRWHKKRENTGSLLIHKGCHDIDVIHWLAGSHTESVVAMGTRTVLTEESDVEDLSSVLMNLKNGVQATYSQCHFAHLACREYMIIGTKGTIRNLGDDPSDSVVQLFDRKGNKKPTPSQEWRFQEEKGFHGLADQRIVREFIAVLDGTVLPSISINDAAWAVKTAYAATASLRNGCIPMKP